MYKCKEARGIGSFNFNLSTSTYSIEEDSIIKIMDIKLVSEVLDIIDKTKFGES